MDFITTSSSRWRSTPGTSTVVRLWRKCLWGLLDCDARNRYASATFATKTCPSVLIVCYFSRRLVLPCVMILCGWTAGENNSGVCRNGAVIDRRRCLFLWSKEVELRHTGRTRLTSIGRWFISLHNKGTAYLNSEWMFMSGEKWQSPFRTSRQFLFILAPEQSLPHRRVTSLRSTNRVHSFYFVSSEVKNLFRVVCLRHCLEEGCGQDVFALPVGT